MVMMRAIHNADFPTQAEIIRPVVAHPSVRRVLIDPGTVGRALSDAFCGEFPDRCEEFAFTAPRKAMLAERLKGFMESKRISVPKDDPVARDDSLCIRSSASASGALTYDGRTKHGHADRFWAACLALQAGVQASCGGVVTV